MRVDIGTLTKYISQELTEVLQYQGFIIKRLGREGAYEIRAIKDFDVIIWHTSELLPEITIKEKQLIPLYA